MSEDLDLVGIQETIKRDFSDRELKETVGNKDFSWFWSPARGHSGGLLVGIDIEDLKVEDILYGTFYLATLIRVRATNYRFWFVNVYGPAQHCLSAEFIQDLRELLTAFHLPIVLGGDFNFKRNNQERNQGQGDPGLVDTFNNFIGDLQLREMFVSGARFTWSNKQRHPTLIKLDMTLVSSCWDISHPSSFAWANTRVGSDHSPLVLDSGEHRGNKTKYFYFQERWFLENDFNGLIGDKWGRKKGLCRIILILWIFGMAAFNL